MTDPQITAWDREQADHRLWLLLAGNRTEKVDALTDIVARAREHGERDGLDRAAGWLEAAVKVRNRVSSGASSSKRYSARTALLENAARIIRALPLTAPDEQPRSSTAGVVPRTAGGDGDSE